jgi:hypothetical protein
MCYQNALFGAPESCCVLTFDYAKGRQHDSSFLYQNTGQPTKGGLALKQAVGPQEKKKPIPQFYFVQVVLHYRTQPASYVAKLGACVSRNSIYFLVWFSEFFFHIADLRSCALVFMKVFMCCICAHFHSCVTYILLCYFMLSPLTNVTSVMLRYFSVYCL